MEDYHLYRMIFVEYFLRALLAGYSTVRKLWTESEKGNYYNGFFIMESVYFFLQNILFLDLQFIIIYITQDGKLAS